MPIRPVIARTLVVLAINLLPAILLADPLPPPRHPGLTIVRDTAEIMTVRVTDLEPGAVAMPARVIQPRPDRFARPPGHAPVPLQLGLRAGIDGPG